MKTTAQETTVTTAMFGHGDVDETKYQAFLNKMAKGYMRARDKATRANNMRSDYFGWTDEQCMAAAHAYCGAYRHQFRALVQIDPTTRKPLAA